MKTITRRVLLPAILLLLAAGAAHSITAQQTIPYDGLKLAYFTETTQTVQERTGIYASSWLTLLFHEVTAASSKVDINANGTIVRNGQQEPQNLNLTADLPTDRDTLIYLRHGGQQSLTIYAGPSSVAIPGFPGLTVDLTRTWDLHDEPLIRTPLGAFPSYRYRTSINGLLAPTGDLVDLDFYASYEKNTQLLIQGEVWASLSGGTSMIVKTELRDTNLTSTQGPSQCLIATAAYRSELAPQVQLLREFRDQKILKTFAGSSFMTVFNLWYYSFSPTVANAIYTNPHLKDAAQVILFPLIIILQASYTVFEVFSFNAEVATIITGLVTSALISIAYLWVPSMLLTCRYGGEMRRAIGLMSYAVGIGLLTLGIAILFQLHALAAVSSVVVVSANLLAFAALPSLFLQGTSALRRILTLLRP